MKFTTSIVVAALAALASAKPSITNTNFDVVAGEPFELKWKDAKGPVTIELKAGTPPNGMKTFKVLATGVSGTSAKVDIPKDVPSGQFAFTVADGPTPDDTNYSVAFSLVGTGASSSVSSSSAVSTTASSTVSSSSSAVSTTSSSATTMTTSTSATMKSNSTMTTSSGSSSTKSSSSSATSAATTTAIIPNSNSSGNKVQSSLALVLLGAVGYAFLN